MLWYDADSPLLFAAVASFVAFAFDHVVRVDIAEVGVLEESKQVAGPCQGIGLPEAFASCFDLQGIEWQMLPYRQVQGCQRELARWVAGYSNPQLDLD